MPLEGSAETTVPRRWYTFKPASAEE